MNPQIHSRWGILCPSCSKPLINPNQPWPQPCATCGTRTHLKCLVPLPQSWLVDLDTDMDPYLTQDCCSKCVTHAAHNAELITNIPHASGDLLQDVFKRWKAQQPKAPKRSVVSLWGDYRVDPDNFVPAVTKVLDIVHSSGPKVRWAVKLGTWTQVPMTNLASKEIILPNYFDSPSALGRTHQEILDAMTGAAMHEAGHAAYDQAKTIIEAQRRIRQGMGQSTWASATCLNIVCDYNLERKVIERYPAFRHYFTETHRWSVNDSLPLIVKALKEDGAEDQINVRLAVLTWEMLGPGDLENAGAQITPRLKWITRKCFDILKYAYTKGYLNSEPGKLKTARALYELVRVINPVGAPPAGIQLPPSQVTTPPGTQTIGGQQQGQPGQPGQSGQGSPQQGDDNDEQASGGMPSDDPDAETGDASSDDGHGTSGRPNSSQVQDPDESTDSGTAPGEPDGADQEETPGDGETQSGAQGSDENQEQGDRQPDDAGAGTDSPGDGEDTDRDPESDASAGDQAEEDFDKDYSGKDSETQDYDDGESGEEEPGNPDNTGPQGEDAGEPGVTSDSPSHQGGKSGSEAPVDPQDDPWTGKGELQDDPTRRKNAKKDALDDLDEENAGRPQDDERAQTPLTDQDSSFTEHARADSEKASNPPPVQHLTVPEYSRHELDKLHAWRVTELSPVISRLKKVLRFRNADWGGQQTGRRAGTLTRRHVNRLSTLHSDKVFHKTMPDQTPKVRIALLVDESDSMRGGLTDQPYIAARNAATALTQALHGIKGVKLWVWGFSLQLGYQGTQRTHTPNMRAYVDPFHKTHQADIEYSPMFGGTPTGEAMEHAAEVLLKGSSPDEKKVCFIITDGEAGGYIATSTPVRKYWGKVTFVHIGIGNTVDKNIPYYVGPVTNIAILPDLLSESVTEILR